MTLRKVICASVMATCVALPALAQGLPKASRPEEVGFSSQRLERLADVFRGDVDRGAIPGAVVLIARNGKLAYFEAFGFQDREKKIPMKTDAIFRITSMTKPITSVAVMMLVEEGKIQLHDPVSLYLPEFKGLKVGIEKKNATTGKSELALEDAAREMTVQDLLRHTSGITYGFFGRSLVKQAYVDAQVGNLDDTLAEFVTKLSKLPLAYQPGTTWDYSHSTDVLGRLVEVVSGMEFDRFVGERIAKPLGLSDTAFSVPQQQAGRLAEPQADKATGKRPAIAGCDTKCVGEPPKLKLGGGGMVSTAADYLRFSQMLLNGGELDGVRLLSPRTVAYMTADQLPPGVSYSPAAQIIGPPAPGPEQGQGFGIGFAVRTALGRNPFMGSPGEFQWVGASGTLFWVDPNAKLIAIMMPQLPVAQDRQHYRSVMRNLVYQAMLD
jgi:CubicO group peptidase (beta-lactamase class C family)